MHRRPVFKLLIVVFVALLAGSASAAPRDRAAKKKINEAIHKHYLETNFDKAETVLLAAIAACGKKCSKPVLAKAWLYVGIVRGSGRNDPRGAKKAFISALKFNSKIGLDEALATAKTKKMFAAARREVGVSAGASNPPDDGVEELGSVEGADCTPKVTEIQTRRPIPVSCAIGDRATKVDLNYKSGGQAWKRVKMKRKRGAFRATIPCAATARKGSVRFYVRGLDADGDIVETYGKKKEPIEIEVVKETDDEPPAFPDKDPPHRCSRASASAGTACSEDDDCYSELSCVEGVCEQALSCDTTEECPSGSKCSEGSCQREKKSKGGPSKKSWFGLHFAFDFALVGGDEVCSLASQQEAGFACFYKDSEEVYRFDPNPDFGNNIKSGMAPATQRLLVSFDQLLGDNVTAGARLGYAFGGGPPAGVNEKVKFFPYHAELRLSYWFGDSPFGSEGFRPFIGLQAGAAQVDAKLPVKIADCAGTPSAPSQPGTTVAQDAAYYQACTAGNQSGVELELDVFKKLGKTFVGAHGGVVYAVSPDSGIMFNLNIMQMLPTSGQVFEPSLGYVHGI